MVAIDRFCNDLNDLQSILNGSSYSLFFVTCRLGFALRVSKLMYIKFRCGSKGGEMGEFSPPPPPLFFFS